MIEKESALRQTDAGIRCNPPTAAVESFYERIKELAAADTDGRLFIMPAPIGSTVWYLDPAGGRNPQKCKVVGYNYERVEELGEWYVSLELLDSPSPGLSFDVGIGYFGKMWFLSEYDASAAVYIEPWTRDVSAAYSKGFRRGRDKLATRIKEKICDRYSLSTGRSIMDLVDEAVGEMTDG